MNMKELVIIVTFVRSFFLLSFVRYTFSKNGHEKAAAVYSGAVNFICFWIQLVPVGTIA